ncbi:substrate-binding domain-containing protein [Romboutsia sp.]|uniref:substrate-binding domain-containing protein n=1 Tax=Romboutsia sp. TaxID=1965302 RepID=UPI002BF35334|nr:substrate-binding domain-containing protein [Romboutsia sp.]HSQ87580.1 substrate-binding domain-containing protein [Romboutsia sp.]
MKMKKKILSLLTAGLLSLTMVACSSTNQNEEPKAETPKEITLATTTSLDDTGFLEATLVDFEKENNVDVKVVAKGTGEALELGKNKDADILFVHAKQKEEDFIKEGYGNDRTEIMYNYFIVVGPDNEHTSKMKDMNITDAFKYIKENNLNFISRGDDSGTNTKELSLWEKAGVENKFENYKESGQGMGATLTMANEMQAYTLTDIGTYLATKNENKDLGIVINSDESLKNVYSIVSISDLPEEKESVTSKLIEYYKSGGMKTKIKEFGVDKYGEPLFFIFE